MCFMSCSLNAGISVGLFFKISGVSIVWCIFQKLQCMYIYIYVCIIRCYLFHMNIFFLIEILLTTTFSLVLECLVLQIPCEKVFRHPFNTPKPRLQKGAVSIRDWSFSTIDPLPIGSLYGISTFTIKINQNEIFILIFIYHTWILWGNTILWKIWSYWICCPKDPYPSRFE